MLKKGYCTVTLPFMWHLRDVPVTVTLTESVFIFGNDNEKSDCNGIGDVT